MENLMNRVYGLTNLALLTPQNLVENIRLDNYQEIKYYKHDREIICEMTAEEDGAEIKYIYHFSKNSQLQALSAKCGEETVEIFNRSKELQALLEKYDKAFTISF